MFNSNALIPYLGLKRSQQRTFDQGVSSSIALKMQTLKDHLKESGILTKAFTNLLISKEGLTLQNGRIFKPVLFGKNKELRKKIQKLTNEIIDLYFNEYQTEQNSKHRRTSSSDLSDLPDFQLPPNSSSSTIPEHQTSSHSTSSSSSSTFHQDNSCPMQPIPSPSRARSPMPDRTIQSEEVAKLIAQNNEQRQSLIEAHQKESSDLQERLNQANQAHSQLKKMYEELSAAEEAARAAQAKSLQDAAQAAKSDNLAREALRQQEETFQKRLKEANEQYSQQLQRQIEQTHAHERELSEAHEKESSVLQARLKAAQEEFSKLQNALVDAQKLKSAAEATAQKQTADNRTIIQANESEITNLRAQIEQAKAQKRELSEAHEKESLELQARLKAAQEEFSKLQDALGDAEKQRGAAEATAQKQAADNRTIIQANESEITNLRAQIEHAKTQKRELSEAHEKESSVLQARLKAAQEEFSKLQNALVDAQKQRSSAEATAQKQAADNRAIIQANESEITKFRAQIEQAKAQKRELSEAHEKESLELQARLKAAQEELRKLQDALGDAQKQRSAAEATAQKQAEANKAIIQANESEITNLRAQIEQAKAQKRVLSESHEKESLELQEGLKASQEELTKLQNALGDAQKQRSAAEATAQKQAEANKEIFQANESEITKLRAQIEQAKAHERELSEAHEKESSELQARLKAAQEEFSKLQNALVDAQKQLKSVKEQARAQDVANNTTIQANEAKIAQLKRQIREIGANEQAHLEELKKLQEALADAEERVKAIETQAKEQAAKSDNLARQALKQQADDFQKRLEELSGENVKLSEQNRKIEIVQREELNRRKLLEKENIEMQEQITATRNKISSTEENLRKIKLQKEEIERNSAAKLQELSKQNAQLDEALQKHTEESKILSKQILQKDIEIEALQSIIKKIKSELSDLQKAYEGLRRLSSVNKNIENLQEETRVQEELFTILASNKRDLDGNVANTKGSLEALSKQMKEKREEFEKANKEYEILQKEQQELNARRASLQITLNSNAQVGQITPSSTQASPELPSQIQTALLAATAALNTPLPSEELLSSSAAAASMQSISSALPYLSPVDLSVSSPSSSTLSSSSSSSMAVHSSPSASPFTTLALTTPTEVIGSSSSVNYGTASAMPYSYSALSSAVEETSSVTTSEEADFSTVISELDRQYRQFNEKFPNISSIKLAEQTKKRLKQAKNLLQISDVLYKPKSQTLSLFPSPENQKFEVSSFKNRTSMVLSPKKHSDTRDKKNVTSKPQENPFHDSAMEIFHQIITLQNKDLKAYFSRTLKALKKFNKALLESKDLDSLFKENPLRTLAIKLQALRGLITQSSTLKNIAIPKTPEQLEAYMQNAILQIQNNKLEITAISNLKKVHFALMNDFEANFRKKEKKAKALEDLNNKIKELETLEKTLSADASISQTAFGKTFLASLGTIRGYLVNQKAQKNCSEYDKAKTQLAQLNSSLNISINALAKQNKDLEEAFRLARLKKIAEELRIKLAAFLGMFQLESPQSGLS